MTGMSPSTAFAADAAIAKSLPLYILPVPSAVGTVQSNVRARLDTRTLMLAAEVDVKEVEDALAVTVRVYIPLSEGKGNSSV